MRRALLLFFTLLVLSAAASASAAPATTYVDIEDQAYRDLDKLVAFGRSGFCIENRLQPFERLLIIGLCFEWLDLHRS